MTAEAENDFGSPNLGDLATGAAAERLAAVGAAASEPEPSKMAENVLGQFDQVEDGGVAVVANERADEGAVEREKWEENPVEEEYGD